jgi:hypothetical protein
VKRFVRVCIGSTALALGVAVAPTAAIAGAAAQAATSPGQFRSQHVTIPAPRVVSLRAVGRAASTRHPDLVPPFRYFNSAAVAAERAAAVRSGGRHSGVTVLAGSPAVVQAVSPAQTWAAFPAMGLARQFNLLGNDQVVEPPDTQVAAGPGAVLEATNDSLSVWSKTGSLLLARDLNRFFPVPSACSTTFCFSDPRVLYDAQSGRWLLSGFSLDSNLDSQTYLAVSATSDPTGKWYVYTVADNSSSLVLTDQPMTGVCDDKLVMSWNEYTNFGSAFGGAQTLVLQKSTLLAGGALGTSDTDLSTNTNEFRLVPAQSLSSTTTCWMTVNNADTALGGSSTSPALGVIAVTGTPNANNVALTETDLPLSSPTSMPPNPRQPSGTTNDIALDDRLVSAVWQNGVLWTGGTDTCTASDCLRLWKVDTSSATPSLLLDTDVSRSGGDLYYPAVSLDSSGDLFVAFSASSPTTYPGAYAVISPATSAGSFSAPVTIAKGQASYGGWTFSDNSNAARWGDYSAAAPDPSVPGAVWVAGEYAPSNAGSGFWATAAAQLSLTAPPRVAVAFGIEGSDGHLWAQAPQLGGGWHSLGGQIVAPPAVAAARNPYGSTPASPVFFIGTGGNKLLYIRSTTAGWQRLGPNTQSCLGGPAAVITTSAATSTLTVACRGLNNALWENTATVPSTGLPQFTRKWTSLGGALSAAPAVAPVGGVVTFFARGTNGRIYIRTLSAGFSAAPWSCAGSPAAAAEAASSDTIFACLGSNHALFEAVNGGAGWAPVVPLGGSLIGGPAIAAASRAAEMLGEGSNHAVWVRTPLTGWTSLGGNAVGGVGAAALN